jgi:hypothetical protein
LDAQYVKNKMGTTYSFHFKIFWFVSKRYISLKAYCLCWMFWSWLFGCKCPNFNGQVLQWCTKEQCEIFLFFKIPQQVNLGRCLCDVNVAWSMCVSNLACEAHGCVCLCVFVSISTCVDVLEKSLCAINYGSRWCNLYGVYDYL